MYEHIKKGNSTVLPREDVEEMTFPPLACDRASEFLLLSFRLLLPPPTSSFLFSLWLSVTVTNIQTLVSDKPSHTHTKKADTHPGIDLGSDSCVAGLLFLHVRKWREPWPNYQSRVRQKQHLLRQRACALFVRRCIAYSRSHQTDSCARTNVEHLLMQPLQISLMRNWFSLLLFYSFSFFLCERARLSLRPRNSRRFSSAGATIRQRRKAARHANRQQEAAHWKEGVTFRCKQWWSQPASFTSTPGCWARMDRYLPARTPTPPIVMLMHCSLMLWKQMELSHQGWMKQQTERWKTCFGVWVISSKQQRDQIHQVCCF